MISDKFINNIDVFFIDRLFEKNILPKINYMMFYVEKKAEHFVYSVYKNIFSTISSKIKKRAL